MTEAQWKKHEAEQRAAQRHWEYLCRNDKPAPAPRSKLIRAMATVVVP